MKWHSSILISALNHLSLDWCPKDKARTITLLTVLWSLRFSSQETHLWFSFFGMPSAVFNFGRVMSEMWASQFILDGLNTSSCPRHSHIEGEYMKDSRGVWNYIHESLSLMFHFLISSAESVCWETVLPPAFQIRTLLVCFQILVWICTITPMHHNMAVHLANFDFFSYEKKYMHVVLWEGKHVEQRAIVERSERNRQKESRIRWEMKEYWCAHTYLSWHPLYQHYFLI